MENTVTLPKAVFDDLLRRVQEIATCPKSEGQFDGYAHALGRCQGMALTLICTLKAYGGDAIQAQLDEAQLDAAQRAELREAEREEHAGDCDDYAVQQERY